MPLARSFVEVLKRLDKKFPSPVGSSAKISDCPDKTCSKKVCDWICSPLGREIVAFGPLPVSEANNVPRPAIPVKVLLPSAVERPLVPRVEAAALKPDASGFADMKNSVEAVGINMVFPLGVVYT